MPKYRSRPTEIEAFQWTGQPPNEWPDWARNSLRIRYEISSLSIDGRHGPVRANNGDWIIMINSDDIYPCDSEVFLAKYEAV